MKILRWLLVCSLVIVGIAVPLTSTSVHAQSAPPWLQMWLIRGENYGDTALLEYRSAAGTVVASFTLDLTQFGLLNVGGGRVASTSMEGITLFDPAVGYVVSHPATGYLPSTDADHYLVSGGVPSPNGQQYAYTMTVQHTDQSLPATSWVYLRPLDQSSERLLIQVDTDPHITVQPVGWSSDGQRLLLAQQPVGIGGYILFWTWPDVSLYNVTDGSMTPVGDVAGYSADGQQFAALEWIEGGGFSNLRVTNVTTGDVMTYPVPNVGETPQQGGAVEFSPSGTKIAYQVARGNPDSEMFWTIVVDQITGQSTVVMTDQATGYDLNYGQVAGWLDDATLVIGAWTGKSAILNVTNGVHADASGEFLGYAEGIADASGFAAPTAAAAQCPGTAISRLQIGGRGRVTYTDGSPVNIRQSPGGNKIGTEPEGSPFTVISGPTCQGGYAWWEVQFDSGTGALSRRAISRVTTWNRPSAPSPIAAIHAS